MIQVKVTSPAGEGSYESMKLLIKGLREDNSTNQIFVLDYNNEIPFTDVFFEGFTRVYNIAAAINSDNKYIIIKTNELLNNDKYSNDIKALILAKDNVINCNKKNYLINKETVLIRRYR